MNRKKTWLVVLAFCIVKLSLHLIADFNSGFQGDELLHIETGNHPAFGYMEFPPVIGWLAYIQNQFGSQAVWVQHIFTHLASILIMIIIALITMELGGKARAVFIALLCILIAPAFGRSQQLFQPVVFSQLFWLLAAYQLVRVIKMPCHKYLIYLTFTLAFGFLVKYDIVFFILPLASLFLFKRARQFLLSAATWKYAILFLVIVSPNVYWQFAYDLPVFQMFSRLYETQLDKLSITGVLKELVIALNPLTALIWIAGVFFMFNKVEKESYRPVAIVILLSIIFLALSKSKAYYFFPSMVVLMIFGSIWIEQKILSKRKWIFYPIVVLMFLSGVILIPYGLSVLPLNSFIKFARIKKKDNHYEVHYQELYTGEKWKNTLTAIRNVFDSLPADEKKDCLIWGKHYSQAGAVNLFRSRYGLPHAFSYHGSFYLWAPLGDMPKTVIAFTNGEAGIDFFQSFFNSVTAVQRIYNPYADFDKDLWQTIYICKGPKQSFDELKKKFETRVFE